MKRSTLNFWLDLVSLLVMVALATTGGIMHWVLPAYTGHTHQLFGLDRHGYGDIHFWFSVLTVVLLALHVLLHWEWICCVVGRAVGRPHPSRRARTAWGLGFLAFTILFLGGGLWWASGHVTVPATPSEGAPHRGREARASQEGDGAWAHHADAADCPAAESINGQTTLAEAARASGLDLAAFEERLGLPAGTNPGVTLGRLRRSAGLSVATVREVVCHP
ncbi:MAG: DUF4405 domain-containing protein [Deltaproteobacteria bacterium]|nr:DUF4405 domain-containing protein [Deltaproteobacteria bacterium]